MKKVIWLALLMPYLVCAQISENFESGSMNNWVQNPDGHWRCDTTASLSGRFSLHHIFDNSEGGNDIAGIPVKNLHPSESTTRWSFIVRHGCEPSSSNNWAVFLMSDIGPGTSETGTIPDGFAAGVNLTGYDDTLRLWKIKSNTPSVVVTSPLNWQTDIGINDAVRIIIERSPEGKWTLLVSRLTGTILCTSSGADRELFYPVWFAVSYKYSSTRDRLFWIDDISIDGAFYSDSKAPEITGCEYAGGNCVNIWLNENPSEDFILPANIALNSEGNHPLSIQNVKPLLFRIEFPGGIRNKEENNIYIKNICDDSFNCTGDLRVPFTPVRAEAGDVIISEIMADPFPEVSLPGFEYLELTNRTIYPFNLNSWQIYSGGVTYPIPASVLPPGGIIILCQQQDTLYFAKYGDVSGLKQFPLLTDGGKILCLRDSSSSLIHGVEYSDEWYHDELKMGGGWSLEMIDTGFPFFYEGNWKASESRRGGTPGTINSVSGNFPDCEFNGIENVFPNDSSEISVRFSEPILTLSPQMNNFKIGGKGVAGLNIPDPLCREFLLKTIEPLNMQKIYQFDASGEIIDFAGNPILKKSFRFGLPEPSQKGDVLFNELLFNPLPGDPDYIELFNNSGKVLDASKLQMVSVNDETGEKSQIFPVSYEKRCILPGTYFAITTDRKRILERYFSANEDFIFGIRSLPSMSDDAGHLILLNRELDIIDEVYYSEDMHFSLLSDFQGIALEKAGIGTYSTEKPGWHSASESAGWGTPGALNSVSADIQSTADKVVLSSSKITPDNDGFEDMLIIQLNLTGNGNIVSVTVFDETGSLVRKVASNMFAGAEAAIVWDGTADDGTLVRTGIYIVLVSIYDDQGKTGQWKKVCTVLR